MLFVVLSLFVI